MHREEVLRRLTAQRSRLADFGVKRLAVFGSVARGDARPDSDVDVLVEFAGAATYDQYMRLKDFLEALLESPVDLLTRKGVRPELVPSIEQEAVYVS